MHVTRWALRAVAAAAVLVALYAAAGWWLAPRFVRDALVEQAAARGLELRLARVRTHPFALAVELQGIEVTGEGGKPFATAASLGADLAWASLWRDAWIVERAELREPSVEFEAGASGWGTGGGRQGSQDEPPSILVRRLVVASGTIHVRDRSRGAPVEVTLEQIHLSMQGLSTGAAQPAPYELSAALAAGGSLRSQGALSLEPLAAHGRLSVDAASLAKVWRLAAPASEPVPGMVEGSATYAYEQGSLALRDIALRAEPQAGGSIAAGGSYAPDAESASLELRAEGLPVSLAQRFLRPKAASGALSSEGTLQLAPAIAYSGSLRVRDLRLVERGSDALLLAWKDARTASIRVSADALQLGEVTVEAPEARLVVEEGGAFNFARAFAGGDGDSEGDGGAFRAALERLRVSGGTLHFADRSLENPFEVTIVALAGGVAGFSTGAGDPARVQLNGRVQPYGTARIRGTIDLDAPTSLADFTARLRNLRLDAFNPYVAKFAGYRIASGRVSAELRYELREGRLVGDNALVFEEMRLGEKVKSEGALDVPLELAVALLADAQGRIALDIPVSGNLRDPQFDFGAIVAKAVGNMLRKIVTAPFRALAGLLGGGRGGDPGRISFAPGAATLSPPAEEDVARVARMLEKRPRLALTVRGGFDPERDLGALRARTVRAEIAARAGADAAKDVLDFADPKVLQVAERLYLERVGNRLELQKLRESEPRYARALVERLAATVPADKSSVETLARARADAVRAELIALGVDGARVRVGDPRQKAAGEEGIGTDLALAAGSPQMEAAPAQDLDIRELQRKLNAAGHEAGPVDGILGPKTRAALRAYREVHGRDPR
ncbi:MAG TPA: DUF748 domain-containing protein [Burkholderiales bacterium]